MVSTTETKEVVRQLIPFLSRKAIPITPENYRIWFEYFLGRKEEIKKRLDELMESGTPFSADLNEKLYTEFFVRDLHQEVEEKVQMEMETAGNLSKQVGEMVVNIMKEVLGGAESTSGYGDRLKKYMGEAGKVTSLEQIQGLLTNLLKDTQEATVQTQKVQKKLETSSNQLENLHSELLNARTEARTDNLTRLWNRRFFDEAVADEVEWEKGGVASCLIMLDIDHFKRFNDEFGHLIGDKLLKHVAKDLKTLSPSTANVCRYGGEEFAIINSGTGLSASVALAEKIRKDIEEMAFTVRGRDIDVTISIGVAEIRDGDSPKSLIERADGALYFAKHAGRNNVKTEKDLPAGAEDTSH